MAVIQINGDNFEEEVLQSKIPVLVDFYTAWCGPCRQLAPVIEEIAREARDFKVAKVNMEEQAELATRYNIMSVPTLIAFRNGKAVNRVVGVIPKDKIMNMIQSN